MERLLPNSPAAVTRRIGFSFVLAMSLIIGGFVLSFYSYNQYSADTERIQHTYQVVGELAEILSQLKDVETSSRGYVVTQDPVFLEPYNTAMPKLSHDLWELRALVADNPAQVHRCDSLEQLISRKLAIAKQQIAGAKTESVIVLNSYLRVGKIRMDNLRRWIALMVRVEETLLAERNTQAQHSFRNTLLIIFTLSLMTFLALIVAYRLLTSELRQRAANEIQLRAYEDELRTQIAQLETSNQELERFAFIASHDLQEPLRKIQSFASLLNDRYNVLLDENGRMFLVKIVGAADRMSKLIKELLNFSRLQKPEQIFRLVSLENAVLQALETHETTIKQTGAEITISSLPRIQAVSSQMEQLFGNLIGNALKFTKPGQQPIITINAEIIDGANYPTLTPGRPYHRIIVSDNGIGFDEKYANHIFELFQRLHGKSTYEGTGIGLAICKRIVVFHKGHIAASSQPGQGAAFTVVLPEKQPYPTTQ